MEQFPLLRRTTGVWQAHVNKIDGDFGATEPYPLEKEPAMKQSNDAHSNGATTIERATFQRDPAHALRLAETHGSVVIIDNAGKVHAVLSVPNDDRPIVD
jgi:hypothetical protein